jgi:hypothetical protein
MGSFLAVTAAREQPPVVAAAVEAFLAEHSATAPADEATETAGIFGSGEWSVVVWPDFFNMYDEPAAQHLSKTRGCLVSSVHSFGDDYWTHLLLDRGEQLDVFCSRPTYHLAKDADEAPLRRAFAGRPDMIADAFGIEDGKVAPYLRHLDVDKPPSGKVFDGDQFELGDIRVFTDLWRQAGIEYPAPDAEPAARIGLALGWQGMLPIGSIL